MVGHKGVTTWLMEAVMNSSNVPVVHYFLAQQAGYADQVWQEYVENANS